MGERVGGGGGVKERRVLDSLWGIGETIFEGGETVCGDRGVSLVSRGELSVAVC